MSVTRRVAKRVDRLLFGVMLSADPRAHLQRLGSRYGGWWVPANVLRENSVVYSAGVGTDVSFDIALIERFGCHVWALDPTPEAVRFAATISNPRWHFVPEGLWSADRIMPFYAPRDPAHSSYSITNLQNTESCVERVCRSLDSHASKLGHNRVDLLKIDIEGAEYDVLGALGAIKPSVLCVEFHQCEARRVRGISRFIAALDYRILKVDGWDATLMRGDLWRVLEREARQADDPT